MMNNEQKKQACQLTNDFYSHHAPDFSATRQHAWRGWEKLPLPETPDVLDVAAGNLRFAKFLAASGKNFRYFGIDACLPLLESSNLPASFYAQLDILACLQQSVRWTDLLPRHDYNFVFCSAFLHHVPDHKWREQLLHDLWSQVVPSGRLAVSFWQFVDDLRHLIVDDLGDHDYYLSWGDEHRPARFAHHFSDEEIDNLVTVFGDGHLIADYHADGHTDRLNRYLIWQKM